MKLKKRTNLFAGNNFLLLVTIILFIVLYLIGILLVPKGNFDRLQTFLSLLKTNAGLLIITASMTMVLIVGGIDISVGSVVSSVCMALAFLIEKQGVSMWVAFAVVLIMGLAYGAFQGFMISYLKIQPFIVTLAGMIFFRGFTNVISAEMINISNAEFRAFADSQITLPFGGFINKKGDMIMPYIFTYVLFALLVVVLIYIMLRFTRFGRNIYAVGGNDQSALLMGLNVRRTRFFVYVLNGFLVALGGIVFCLISGSGSVDTAKGIEMDAIAGSVIGGTLLTGGVGNVFGSLIGVLIRSTIQSFISALSLNSWWSRIAIAALLAFFIIIQSVFVSIRDKRK